MKYFGSPTEEEMMEIPFPLLIWTDYLQKCSKMKNSIQLGFGRNHYNE